MGCGSSSAAPSPATGHARPRPGLVINARVNNNTGGATANGNSTQHQESDEEDSPTVPPSGNKFESSNTSRSAASTVTTTTSKSAVRLPAPQPEMQVGNILDELFEYDDCKVLVSEVLKAKQERQLRVRRPLAKSKTITTDGEDDARFQFGDFNINTKHQDAKEDSKKNSLAAHMLHNYSTYTLLGHSTRVKCVALSPAETQYVSCSNEDSSLTLWDCVTGKEVSTFMGHEDTILCVAFSPDNKYLATCSRDNHMILWDVVTAKQLVTFEHPRVVICCAFTPDAKLLVSGCQDKVCRVWDTKRGKECMNFARHEAIVVSLSITPLEEQCKGGMYPVCSGSADKTVRIWNASGPGSIVNNNAHIVLQGHTGIVLCCQYAPNGLYIVSSDEKLIKVWAVADNSCVCTFNVDNIHMKTTLVNKMPKRLTWTLVQFCPQQFGLCLAAVSNTRTVHLFDIDKEKEGESSEVLQLYARAPVHCLSAGKDHKLVYGDTFGNIYVTKLK